MTTPHVRPDHDDPHPDADHDARARYGNDLPSGKGLINVAAVVMVVMAAIGIIVGLSMDLPLIGMILCVSALVGGIVLVVLANNDARAGLALPICAIIAGLIGGLIVLLAGSGVDNDELEDAPARTILGDEVVEEQDGVLTDGPNDTGDLPEDPAEIINPDPEDDLPGNDVPN